MARIPLGPYLLDAPLGVGGMGEVWGGVHVGQGVPVAVKVVTAASAQRPEYLAAFRNEVRAVAGLDHPGIIMVFDHGEIPKEAHAPSGGRLVPGSPYLVMELASGGSLDRAVGALYYDDLRSVLLALLEALAHAHARGVIHRDLKPGNVLVATAKDQRPGIKLADFGLSHAGEALGQEGRNDSGTPRYMAPEQFLGRWRDYGPWTDLYAFGCVAWELVAGRPAFPAHSYGELRQAHLYGDPPPLPGARAVPAGYEAWLRRLLEKDHRERFSCAADAAAALRELGDPAAPGEAFERVARSDDNATLAFSLGPDTAPPDTQSLSPSGGGEGWDEGAGRDGVDRLPRLPAPMPSDWRAERPAAAGIQLVGAGLGLYGLRQVPLVGRASERDRLWAALAEVRESGQMRALQVEGVAGVGKSRFVESVAERALELGAAVVLQARAAPGEAPFEGLGRMVAAHLRCSGLGGPELPRRLEMRLRAQGVDDPYEWQALAELISPTDPAFFTSPTERFALIRRVLDRATREGSEGRRPLLLWLDDLQWSPEARAFARWLLQAPELPVLLVLTGRPDGEEALLPLISLGVLDAAERQALVQGLLLLEPGVAEQVEARTAGLPLFAVQLVGDWVRRGLLVPGPQGFHLLSGAQVEIPDDIHALWTEGLTRALEPAQRRALQQAAVLGAQVDIVELRLAFAASDTRFSEALLERLAEAGLVVLGPSGFSFVHQMLRESLEREAREAGDLPAMHAAAAEALASLHPAGTPGLAARLGVHLAEAGRFEDALAPLARAAGELRRASEFRSAFSLLERLARALDAIGASDADPRRLDMLLESARVLSALGRYDEAAARAREVSRLGGPRLAAQALLVEGIAVGNRGDRARWARLTEEALEGALAVGDLETAARARLVLASLARTRGERELAASLAEQARQGFAEVGEARGLADALLLLAQLSGDRILAAEARERFAALSARVGVASCENFLADQARKGGDLEAAERGYRAALAMLRRIGSPEALVPLLNLGQVQSARGSVAQARASIEEGLGLARRLGRRAWEDVARVLLLPVVARAGDWEAFDEHFVAARAASGRVDPDLAEALTEAARLCRGPRAREAWGLALAQWEALGRDDRSAEARAALEG